ncbi:ribosome biogenesis GTPase Der [Stagnimonas aquatica]|uniref:ribosome biogenesis GTPase Der n=1 Tax=Stagnimonas aquatica TaxID=2689987 RepID=UPI00267D4714
MKLSPNKGGKGRSKKPRPGAKVKVAAPRKKAAKPETAAAAPAAKYQPWKKAKAKVSVDERLAEETGVKPRKPAAPKPAAKPAPAPEPLPPARPRGFVAQALQDLDLLASGEKLEDVIEEYQLDEFAEDEEYQDEEALAEGDDESAAVELVEAPPLPVVVLVGRPNVGKSTLFNRLTNTRDALVYDLPGLTRDRQYGQGRFEGKSYIVVDTGGLSPAENDALAMLAEEQAQIALEEADRVFFLVDAESGCLPDDEAIARRLRKLGKPVTVLVNKAEGKPVLRTAAEFHVLGLGDPRPVSAEHGDGITALLREQLAGFPESHESYQDDGIIRVAVVGRPNAGKSTLVNRLLGEDRVLTADVAGTTRDAIRVRFERDGHRYELIDTAGIRRRSRVSEVVEKFSIVKALQAIEDAHVVILVTDAHDEISTQDAKLMGLVAQRGRALVLAINKWDHLADDKRAWIKSEIDFRLPFLDFVPPHFISALHGSGLRELMEDVVLAYESTTMDIPTPELTRALEAAVDRHSPPAVLGRRIKLRYAHQTGTNPIRILVHGNQTEKLPLSYHRYLINEFRAAFQLKGVPILLEFKTGENPFKGKRNVLTNRQLKKRRRTLERFR